MIYIVHLHVGELKARVPGVGGGGGEGVDLHNYTYNAYHLHV